jgi:hypothetical protein
VAIDSQEEIKRREKGEIATVRSSLVLTAGTVGSLYSSRRQCEGGNDVFHSTIVSL